MSIPKKRRTVHDVRVLLFSRTQRATLPISYRYERYFMTNQKQKHMSLNQAELETYALYKIGFSRTQRASKSPYFHQS